MMNTKKISGVVFDFGGVMTTTTMPTRVIDLAAKLNIPYKPISDGFDKYRLQYDGGFMTIEEMYDHIWSDAGLDLPKDVREAFLAADVSCWLYHNEKTLYWMKALKERGFKIGILTNMAPKFAQDHFKKEFSEYIVQADAMVISGEVKLFKPQKEIYELLQSRIGLPPEELCFIDDLEVNINAAKNCRWQGIRFINNEQVERDFEALLAAAAN